jgi:diguanylate cyclase (GGDEF)-like protein
LNNILRHQLTEKPTGTVLVVDDEPSNIQAIFKVLGDDYKVLMATNSEQALRVCKKHIPDLILLDVMMPDVDGLETCRIIKEDPHIAHIPIIFVTSMQGASNEEKCWLAGAADFIHKPIVPMTLINRVKVHISQKHQADLLRSLAYKDGLTGIYNRRYFDHSLERQSSLSARNNAPLSLLMIDIDFFKRYNDTLGHLAGDDALRGVAELLQSCCNRPTDLAARYGGEEFAVLLPDTTEDGAVMIAKNILSEMKAANIPHPDSERPYLTVSIGIAVSTDGETTSLLDLADKQLYLAKKLGRNTFHIDDTAARNEGPIDGGGTSNGELLL